MITSRFPFVTKAFYNDFVKMQVFFVIFVLNQKKQVSHQPIFGNRSYENLSMERMKICRITRGNIFDRLEEQPKILLATGLPTTVLKRGVVLFVTAILQHTTRFFPNNVRFRFELRAPCYFFLPRLTKLKRRWVCVSLLPLLLFVQSLRAFPVYLT